MENSRCRILFDIKKIIDVMRAEAALLAYTKDPYTDRTTVVEDWHVERLAPVVLNGIVAVSCEMLGYATGMNVDGYERGEMCTLDLELPGSVSGAALTALRLSLENAIAAYALSQLYAGEERAVREQRYFFDEFRRSIAQAKSPLALC